MSIISKPYKDFHGSCLFLGQTWRTSLVAFNFNDTLRAGLGI